MERTGGSVPYHRIYEQHQGGGGVETAKRDRAVLRQYLIKFVYFFNHCDLTGCSYVYGWVVLAKKAPQRQR
jgi:hypothetical protein